jgi:hypothetical protein
MSFLSNYLDNEYMIIPYLIVLKYLLILKILNNLI